MNVYRQHYPSTPEASAIEAAAMAPCPMAAYAEPRDCAKWYIPPPPIDGPRHPPSTVLE